MTKDKQASVGWISLVHAVFSFIAAILLAAVFIFVIGFVVVPLILGGLVPDAFDATTFLESGTAFVLISLIALIALWWGTANSAKMILRRYARVDTRKLLLTSLLIFTLLSVVGPIADLYYGEFVLWESLIRVADLVVFYIVSRKYFLQAGV